MPFLSWGAVRGSRPRKRCVARVEALEPRALLTGLGWVSRPSGPLPHDWAEIARQGIGRTPRPLSNLPYTSRGGETESLDIYRPTGPPPAEGWPVVLAIHGGGWYRFSKNQYGPKAAAAMVPRGYVVVAPNYALATNDRPSWPLNFDQLQDAVAWVRSHAEEYGLDPDRVVAMGESAGGHLAALLGTSPRDDTTRVQAVVDFFGPTDLALLSRSSGQLARTIGRFLGEGLESAPERYQDASPNLRVTPTSAPVLMIHGDRDTVVRSWQSTLLRDALTAAGVDNELIIVPGGMHGLGFKVRGRDLVGDVIAFLERTLGPAGEA